jgi:hypothetical protein
VVPPAKRPLIRAGLAILCCVIVGAALGLQTAYILTLHNQVERLHSQVCAYQMQAIDIERALASAGVPQVTVPPPQDCG